MNAPSRAEMKGDIDARILAVEQRLIAREDRLRRDVASLSGQLRDRLSPRQWLPPVGAGLLTVAALAALWRRPAPPAPPTSGGAPLLARLPWMQLIGLAWPLLPERWRQRVSPATAGSFLTLGLPLVERLLGGRRDEPLATVADVDLKRLSGRWFIVGELAAHGQPASQAPEIGLLPRDDGRLDLLQRRIDASGTHGSEALVEAVQGSHGGRFRISHWPEALRWLPLAWDEQGVLHVDEAYDEALIGSAARDTLWLLSRRPSLADERRQALTQMAREHGFAVEALRSYDNP
ncbi:lipocalin family protein [Roseateles sp. NT4]|uniref:lipocalin family protein n=1 Tax=Roseateles sp. NT4 TaxID=3453715 RepID=UPI003EE91A2D